MVSDDPSSAERVVNFRRGRVSARPPAPSPVEDLAKYERGEGADDYRHRMMVNIAASCS